MIAMMIWDNFKIDMMTMTISISLYGMQMWGIWGHMVSQIHTKERFLESLHIVHVFPTFRGPKFGHLELR